MKVTVKQYLEDTHEVSCIVEDKVSELGNVIIADPFSTNAVETPGANFRLIGRSMVGKVYEMTDYEINDDDIYCPNKLEELKEIKTQPCPICGTPLETPKDYFPALHKMIEKLESHSELVIKDYEIGKELDKKHPQIPKYLEKYISGQSKKRQLLKNVNF